MKLVGRKAGDKRARNLRKFSSKCPYSCVDEHNPSNITSAHNH